MESGIKEFHDYVLNDVLSHIDGITSKRMFGGFGLYKDGAIFAIITSDSELYFKVDDTNRAQFEKHGSEPFVYIGHKTKKPTQMPYWILPSEIMEDKEVIEMWVEQSARISKSALKSKKHN